MNDERLKRRRAEEGPDVFGEFIRSNNLPVEQILSFLPYEDIERLCSYNTNTRFRMCGVFDDTEVLQFLDKAILGRREMVGLVNEFENQFFDDFWEARLRDDFGLSIVPALDSHYSLAVSRWSGAAIEFIIKRQLRDVHDKIALLAQNYPDNFRRRALGASPRFGRNLARLITFRNLYQDLYNSNHLFTQPGTGFLHLDHVALHVSPQISVISVRQFTDESYEQISIEKTNYFVGNVFLAPTALILYALGRDKDWSNLLSTIPTEFVHYVDKVKGRFTEGNEKIYSTLGASDIRYFHMRDSLAVAGSGTATAFIIFVNTHQKLIITFTQQTIWSGWTSKLIRNIQLVVDNGNSVSLFSLGNSGIGELFLSRPGNAGISNSRPLYEISQPTLYRSFEFSQPTLYRSFEFNPQVNFRSVIAMPKSLYELGHFQNVRLDSTADNSIQSIMQGNYTITQLPLTLPRGRSFNGMFYDVAVQSVVLSKIIISADDNFVFYLRFELANTNRNTTIESNLSDYKFTVTKVNYQNSQFTDMWVPGMMVRNPFFDKNRLVLVQPWEDIHVLSLDLNTYVIGVYDYIEKLPNLHFQVPLVRLDRMARLVVVEPISVEQIYYYDSAING